MASVEAYLEKHLQVLASIGAEEEIDLTVSWTPREGQDGLRFPPRLIALIAQLNGGIFLDTYSDQ